ncbi:large ribosomal subunit protein uL30w-like [Cicer arietinum]|uniref:60S ribosomal protein L7-4-like n=1 Tax=Cicer arietinum TaxID=3827 RepID=A0A1S3EEH4_CICAR|nr:60S ribosomal protein L7-4-like [Cicer arietinum]
MAKEEVKSVVPESILKKQKRSEEWALAKKQELESEKKKRSKTRKLIWSRAKQYAKEYDDAQKELISLKREANAVF